MASVHTPVGELFESLKKRGSITYRELAIRVLSSKPLANGVSPASRASDRVWLSRYVVHAPVETLQPAYFADFGESAVKVVSMMRSRSKRAFTNQQIFELICDEAAPSMERVLAKDGQDTSLFRNLLMRLRDENALTEAQRAEVAMVLLVSAGCSADAGKAAAYTIDYMRSLGGPGIVTPESPVGAAGKPAVGAVAGPVAGALAENATLGLLRVVDGYVVGAPHWLDREVGVGTVVGALAEQEGALREVGEDVSGRHARIWRSESGEWLVEGLGSRNGTTLVDGATRERVVVEPPASDRDGWQSAPVPLRPGDELTFGATTRFVVIAGMEG